MECRQELAPKVSKAKAIILGYLILTLLVILDQIALHVFSFLLFYLIPIYLITWFVGRSQGVFIALISAGFLFFHDLCIYKTDLSKGVPYWNLFLSVAFFLFVVYALSRLKGALTREKEFASIDYLTNVANSRFFAEITNREINRSLRYNRPITLAYIDVDNFKLVNDRFGHTAGDALLKKIAETITQNTRNIDLTARLGGDEFAILLPDTGYEGSQIVLQRVHKKIEEIAKEKGFQITVSIGAVTCAKPPCSFDEFVRMADTEMYAAKQSGKNLIKHQILD